MKMNIILIVSFILILFNTSCVHYYYAPSSNNVPLFKTKNEGRIQAQYSTVGVRADESNTIDGFEMQTAYAVGNHAALQLNFLHAGDKEKDYGSGSGNYIEAAGGYFKPLHNNNWIFETYGGIGLGGVNSTYIYETSYASENAKTSITKFFVQPSFGFSKQYFAFAISSKFSMVNFGLGSSSLTKENNPTDYDYTEAFKHHTSYFWWEPGFMIRAGFKNIQAYSQLTLSVQNTNLPFCDVNGSIGIIVPFKIKSK